MCSELFRIPYDWGDVPVFGFGLLLAVWAIIGAATLISLVRRYGWGAETISYLPVLVLVGAAIVLLPRLLPGGFPIRGYGVMLLVGITSGVGLAVYRARRVGLDPEIILSLAIWLVVSGVIGARVFYVIEYWGTKFGREDLKTTILDVLNFPEGGLVVYGGFLGAAAAFLVFAHKHRLPVLAMADLVAPSLMVGLACGRIGCFLNGCCYGGETERPWAMTFPKYSSRHEADKLPLDRRYSPPYSDQAVRGQMHGFVIESREGDPALVTRVERGSIAATAGLKAGDSIVRIDGDAIDSFDAAKAAIFKSFANGKAIRVTLRSGHTIDLPPAAMPDRSRPVHPTQLYSAIDAGLLAWLLWAYYPLRRRDGEVIALVLLIHPITRFLLEYIRIDEPAVFGTSLSISQNISIVLFLCGVALWWYLAKEPRGTVWGRTA
jgi:phosphatidylglycerol:prolipoprotein diacylglycerol transferase